jgi:hypothetical protein
MNNLIDPIPAQTLENIAAAAQLLAAVDLEQINHLAAPAMFRALNAITDACMHLSENCIIQKRPGAEGPAHE